MTSTSTPSTPSGGVKPPRKNAYKEYRKSIKDQIAQKTKKWNEYKELTKKSRDVYNNLRFAQNSLKNELVELRLDVSRRVEAHKNRVQKPRDVTARAVYVGHQLKQLKGGDVTNIDRMKVANDAWTKLSVEEKAVWEDTARSKNLALNEAREAALLAAARASQVELEVAAVFSADDSDSADADDAEMQDSDDDNDDSDDE